MNAFALRIEADHPSLPGHFPGRPVVPGVVLLDAVAALLPAPLARIVQVKFVAPLLPGQDARIELDLDDAARRARFRVLRGDTLLASGDLQLATP
jgi:3-hydroxymyristoyl/3-hydroxydecanoyl-(acyl carrier protein) dehydratase